jgi:hypothetical protein
MTTYALRARNLLNTFYVEWTSDVVDTAGDDAPVTILPGSVIVQHEFLEQDVRSFPDPEIPIFADIDTPNYAAPNIRSSTIIVQVDTTSVNWVDGGIIYLAASASPGGRVIVKDVNGGASSKSILVDGNGLTIDGGLDLSINADYASYTFLYDGVEWVVV